MINLRLSPLVDGVGPDRASWGLTDGPEHDPDIANKKGFRANGAPLISLRRRRLFLKGNTRCRPHFRSTGASMQKCGPVAPMAYVHDIVEKSSVDPQPPVAPRGQPELIHGH